MVISDQVLIAILTNLPVTIAAIAGLIVSFKNKTEIEKVHIATNSMKDELVKTTRAQALLEGAIAGRVEGKDAANTNIQAVEAGRAEGFVEGTKAAKDATIPALLRKD